VGRSRGSTLNSTVFPQSSFGTKLDLSRGMTNPWFRPLARTSLVLVVSVLAVPAQAQQTSWGDVAVSAAAVDYDLSGTGQTAGLAVRLTRDLTDHLVVEARGLFARPNQQFGPSTFVIPEGQLQYRWNLARVTPFVGGGLGASVVRSDFHTDWDPAMSVAGGAGIRLTRQLGLLAEMRVRGIEWDFAASTAEWSLGLAWRLPGF
jgi:hypothetical protein